MKMRHADIQWEQPAPKGHGFSLFLWVMVLLFIAFVLVMAYAALTWKAPTSQDPGSQPQLGIAAETDPTSSPESGSASVPAQQPDGEWNLLLVNRWNPLPENYTVDLVEVPEGQQVDERIYQPLMEMLEAAREGNLGELPQVLSGYRTQEEQERLFQEEIDGNLAEGCSEEEARELAQQWVAVPGTSEHQLGLAVDLVDLNYQILDNNQENTPVQQWLMEHCWEYGFILRYPNEKSAVTGIIYEPWHYRYVGREAAKEITESGLCLEEYLETLAQGNTVQ